ncbi:MAG: glycoside hydrolase domain-containing protein [Candidatus Omnitrophota bacterium]
MKKKLLLLSVIVFFIMLSFLGWQKCFAGEGSVLLKNCQYPQEVRAGEDFDVTFEMEVTEDLKKDCGLFLHVSLRRPKADIKTTLMINADSAVAFPTSRCKVGDIIKLGPYKVNIPLDAPPGEYSMEAGLFWTQEYPDGSATYEKIPYVNPTREMQALRYYWQVVPKITVSEPRDENFTRGSTDRARVYIQNSLTKVFPVNPFFLGEVKNEINLSAAKNEFESVQISVAAPTVDLKGVKFVASDFMQNERQGVISKDNIKLFLVKYVNTSKPYYNTSRVGAWPDPLVPLSEPMDIAQGKFNTVWFQVYVPKNALAGRYEGNIDIISKEQTLATLKVYLTVRNFALPTASHLKTAFDLKESIFFTFYPKDKRETPENYKLRLESIKRAYNMDMLRHRLDPVHNMDTPKLLKREGGVFNLDFSDFDRKADFYLKNGQKTFSIGEYWSWQSKDMWGKWYGFRDEESIVGVFGAYGKHLKEKGWSANAYAYIFDETFYRVKEVTALIHKADPGIKNLLTMPPDPEYKDIDIWCPRINNFDPASVEPLKAKGKEVWTYIAGTTRPYPNLNLDVAAIEPRILPWICWKFNIGGLLYWSMNWWSTNVNPWENAMTYPRQNGNGCLYYPDKFRPVGSIRLEVLRDGMEDYELFYLLRKRVDGLKKLNNPGRDYSLISRSEAALKLDEEIGEFPAYYTHTPNDIYQKRNLVAGLIEEVDALGLIASDAEDNNDSSLGPEEYSAFLPMDVRPVAVTQVVTTNKGVSKAITLSAVNLGGEALAYAVTNPAHGILSGSGPKYIYTSNAGYSGPDTFTFTVSDSTGVSDLAAVKITVVNRKPMALPHPVATYRGVSKAATLAGIDPDRDSLTYVVTTNPIYGTLSGTSPNFIYVPNPGYVGPDAFTFTVSDGTDVSSPATVNINVVNHKPVALARPVVTYRGVSKAATLAGVDSDKDTLTYIIVTNPAHGTLSGTSPNFIYVPNPGYVGPDAFTFTVSDGTDVSSPATVNINVVNHKPAALARPVVTNKNVSKAATLAGVDSDNDTLTYIIVTNPAHGTLSGTKPNLTYVPNPGYVGADAFIFTVSDGTDISSPATININVINHKPIALAHPVATYRGISKAATLAGVDSDNDVLIYANTNPAHGTLSGTSPNFIYVPNPGYVGPDAFTFTVSDGVAVSNSATININVINHKPNAFTQSVTTNKGISKAITLTSADSDGDSLIYATTNPAHGTLFGSGPSRIYVPSAGYSGSDAFTFTVSDGVDISNSAKVNITVVNK